MALGGRRPGAGRPTGHAVTIKREARADALLAEQEILHPRYRKFLEAAAYWAEGEKATGCLRCRKLLIDCRCHKPDKGEIWLRPPDKAMVQYLIDKVGGRAGQAPVVQAETAITVRQAFERPPMPGAEPVEEEEAEA